MKRFFYISFFTGLLFLSGPLTGPAQAKTAGEINAGTEDTLKKLQLEVPGAVDVLKKAKGVLIFPGIWKGGIGLGGEYGEGVLKVKDKIKDYYSITGLSLGFQLGLQKHRFIIAFMEDSAFNQFRASDGWELGLDGSAVLVKVGVDGRIDSYTSNAPVLVFVVGKKGLMYNLTIEGYKIAKIKK